MSDLIVARTKDSSLRRATGKGWEQWQSLLNRAGASSWSHQKIVSYLHLKHHLTPWWQQIVAAGYEVLIGKRVEGQNLKGEYSLTVTKTLPLGQKDLWRFLTSQKGLGLWLQPLDSDFRIIKGAFFESAHGFFGEVRTMKIGERVRLRCQDPSTEKVTILQMMIVERTESKSILVVMIEKIHSGRVKAEMRDLWKAVFETLAQEISPG